MVTGCIPSTHPFPSKYHIFSYALNTILHVLLSKWSFSTKVVFTVKSSSVVPGVNSLLE